jgi:pyridoxal phosphate enzyme (YggS family)
VQNSDLSARIAAVRVRIAAAARRTGREPGEVTLVAVSKGHSPEVVATAYAAGLRLFGENRVEEAGPKAAAVVKLIAPAPAPAWHMIGHVQSRKAEHVLPWASMVHSVDSVKLARQLNKVKDPRQGAVLDIRYWGQLPILLEVNVSGEASKYGFAPAQLPEAVVAIAELSALRIAGLMTMAPIAADDEQVRPVFAGLRRLRDELARRFPALDWHHLSMGMSDDFEVAIEEGATLVRIGRALFG